MTTRKILFLICLFSLLGFGCSLPVLRQDIPVSSNPMGAEIYANGIFAGYTPATVSLERNRDHILTLSKENYRQEDIPVIRQYLQGRVMMKAISSGVNTGLMFKDAGMGLSSGYQSIAMQEQTGEAYILVPSAVTLNLIPLYGQPPGASYGGSPPPGPPSAGPVPSRPSAPPGMYPGSGDPYRDMPRYDVPAVIVPAKPIEKKWESSSTKTYVKPDGTRVTEKSGSSVSVGVNPAGVADVIDKLFRP